MNTGFLNIISGPSGAGKSTLIKRFLAENKEYIFPTSITTRSPREGEKDGDHYHFVSEKEFLEKKEAGDFLEWANVYGMYYGTLKSTIIDGLKNGKKFIKDIDVQGAKILMKLLHEQDYTSIFIAPPSIDILKKRLLERGSESNLELSARLKEAENEMGSKHLFKKLIVNDNIEQAYLALIKIIHS